MANNNVDMVNIDFDNILSNPLTNKYDGTNKYG